ncbi:sensor domain-containing diguanylate cyclase [Crassaminicella thermophila]|uniref:Sensor domain-containing diguanylate cyclase n=1 Tax=Crassaminicella thermophila TaxID=2599308 RepID=A0A5C0SC93_CRATE|nr:sensor domain-containing diguanylate cyclase [Crassaminicella thermophila]QEK11557.1 sensor domain-containing diguanylate cyclase [Crassaminicella thermophila]
MYPALTSIILGFLCFYKLKIIDQNIKNMLHVNKEMEKYNEMKDVMLQISNSIIHMKNMDELLQLFVDSIVQIFDKADTASILIKNDDGLFEYKAVHGFDLDKLSEIKLSIDETFLASTNYKKSIIIKNPKLFNYNNIKKYHYNLLTNQHALDIKSTICTPILIDDQLYGIINVDSIYQNVFFTKEDLAIMEYLAGQLSVSMKNVLLFEKTLFLSRYDGLTKLYHRHYFDELYNNIFERAKRYNEKFCLCIIDLNNFKQINDKYGHLAGDLVIQYFSDMLKKHVRASDLIGRFGGDEFILLFINTDKKQVQKKLASLSKIISQNPLSYENNKFYVQFSYGISSFPEDSIDHKALIKIADSRMYKHKISKKNM